MRGEKLLSIPLAVECVTGVRPHPVTCWRWTTKGVSGGIKLEARKLGGRLLTSKEAVQRFLDATTERSQENASFEPILEAKPNKRAAKASSDLKAIVGGGK